MAGLSASVESALSGFSAMVKSFPELKARVMSRLGKQGRLTLKGQLLSGQELDLSKTKDKKGRYTISNKVGKGANSVAIKSYPVNLFERGRVLRNGRRETGKKIITGKLKTLVNANLQTWSNQAINDIMQKEFDKV